MPRVPKATDYHDPKLHRAIKRRVLRIMYQTGMSQAELARQAGVGLSTLNGQMTKPSFQLDLLVRIAKPLGVSVGYLIGERERDIKARTALAALREIEAVLERAR